MIYVVVLADNNIFILLQYHSVSIITLYYNCNALLTQNISFITTFTDLLHNATLVRM